MLIWDSTPQDSYARNAKQPAYLALGSDPDQPKVLVVDDHTPSRMTAVAFLSVEGYAVTEASSGQMALDCIVKSAPDLILLDVMMPDLDGFEVC